MAKKPISRATINRSHPLAGTWVQAPNRWHITSVVYAISVERGRFKVGATDTDDGTVLRISGVKWDGRSLRFKSFYPPNRHSARHVLTSISTRRMRHDVKGAYSDGVSFAEREVWVKKVRRAAR